MKVVLMRLIFLLCGLFLLYGSYTEPVKAQPLIKPIVVTDSIITEVQKFNHVTVLKIKTQFTDTNVNFMLDWDSDDQLEVWKHDHEFTLWHDPKDVVYNTSNTILFMIPNTIETLTIQIL